MRILIVEDEFYSRKSMVKLCQNYFHSISLHCEILEAEDGEEALNIYSRIYPDIILTDIKLPGMSGLDFLKTLRVEFQFESFTSVIIFSGYAEFEYAKSAVDFGISSYLLKPIDKSELFESLNKAHNEILTKKGVLRDLDYSTIFQYCFNPNLYDKAQISKLSNILEAKYSTYMFMMILSEQNIAATNIYKVFSQSIVYCISKQQYLLFFGMHIEYDFLELTEKCKLLIGNSDYEMKFIFSKITRNFSKIVKIYHETKIVSYEAFMRSDDLIFCMDIVKSKGECNTSNFKTYYPELEFALKKGDRDSFCEYLSLSILNIYNGQSYPQLIELIIYIEKYLSIKPNGLLSQFLDYSIKNDFGTLNFVKPNHLEKLILLNVAELFAEGSINESNPVKFVIEFINDNFSDNLTLKDICNNYLHLHPSYVGQLIKKETSYTFNQILRTKRMKESAQLLIDTDLRITDIGLLSGYNDTSLFIKHFKKEFGLTPGKYRLKINGS